MLLGPQPSIEIHGGSNSSYLFPEVCDGLLHFQNKFLDVICPWHFGVFIGSICGVAKILVEFPSTVGGEKGKGKCNS